MPIEQGLMTLLGRKERVHHLSIDCSSHALTADSVLCRGKRARSMFQLDRVLGMRNRGNSVGARPAKMRLEITEHNW